MPPCLAGSTLYKVVHSQGFDSRVQGFTGGSCFTSALSNPPRLHCRTKPACRYDAAVHSMDDLRRLMTYSRRFVQTVTLRQLPSHLDLQVIFDCMIK